MSVSVWHASTCNTERRDWRIVNLDDPCTCGFVVPSEDLCANLAVLWGRESLQETEPGKLPDDLNLKFTIYIAYMSSFEGSLTCDLSA